MKEGRFKKFILNPWTVSIGSGLVVLLVTIIIDVVKAETIFSTIADFIFLIGRGIKIFLNFEIKVWWLLIGIAIIVLGFIIYSKVLDLKQEKEDENIPPFENYKSDKLLGWNWEWSWYKNWEGIYYIEGLHIVCDKCKTPLRGSYGGYVENCLRCNKHFSYPLPEEDDVKLLIYDNARKNNFEEKED